MTARPYLVALTLSALACGDSFGESHPLVRSETFPLGGETRFVVTSPFVTVLQGSRRTNELSYELDAVMTASTATTARRLAEAVRIDTEELDGGRGVRLRFAGIEPSNGQVSGDLSILVPDDLDVEVISSRASATVEGFEGDVEVDALRGALVVDAAGSVDVAVRAGNAIVQAEARQGTRIVAISERGDVQLTLPIGLSARIQAAAGPGAQIVVDHPRLPSWPGGGLPYAVTVGGGLSEIGLQALAGNVIILGRP